MTDYSSIKETYVFSDRAVLPARLLSDEEKRQSIGGFSIQFVQLGGNAQDEIISRYRSVS